MDMYSGRNTAPLRRLGKKITPQMLVAFAGTPIKTVERNAKMFSVCFGEHPM